MTVDADLARALIRSQFAEVACESVELLGDGWDSTVYTVDGAYAFRFPRRATVIAGFRRELAVLPLIALALPLAVPAATHVGAPSRAFAWPFAGAPLIAGTEAVEAGLGPGARLAVATSLGRFLATLHDPALAARVEHLALPVDPLSRSDMALRVPLARERLAVLRRRGLLDPSPALAELFEEALAVPPPAAPVLAHGDLHPRHLLVGPDGIPTGVIDWIDVCLADPAIDLVPYWSLLDGPARERFLDVYGHVEHAQLVRARLLAAFLAMTLAQFAADEGRERLLAGALGALELTLATG